jgi:cytochrome P450
MPPGGGRTRAAHALNSIWLAGVDSSSRLLGNAANAFSEYPDQWDAVRAHLDLIPNAVEELMRWTPRSIPSTVGRRPTRTSAG